MPRIQTRRPGGTQISEVASAGESLRRPLAAFAHRRRASEARGSLSAHRAREESRNPCRSRPGGRGAPRLPDRDSRRGRRDWLIAREMPGEQERGRIRGQPHHRHPCAEGLNREYDLRGQTAGEVLHAGGDIPAGQELKSSRSNIPRAYARRNRDPAEALVATRRLRRKRAAPKSRSVPLVPPCPHRLGRVRGPKVAPPGVEHPSSDRRTRGVVCAGLTQPSGCTPRSAQGARGTGRRAPACAVRGRGVGASPPVRTRPPAPSWTRGPPASCRWSAS